MGFIYLRSSAVCQNMSSYSVCLCPVKTATWKSESPQFQSHSQWINYENNSFPAIDVLSYIPAVYLQAFTLPRPLHFYCFYRQQMTSGAQVVICEVEYTPITSALCNVHTLSVMHFQALLLYSECISLSALAVHCIFCCITLPQAMFEVTTLLSQRRPDKKAVYHLMSAPRYTCKQTWFTSESSLSLQAPTSIPSSLPHLTSLHSKDVFIINLVPGLFLKFHVFFLIFK